MKRVRVTVSVDEHFLRLLRAEATISGATKPDRRLTPGLVLARVVGMEGMGGFAEQIHAAIPHEWRPHIEAVHEERRVYDATGQQIAGPTIPSSRRKAVR